MTNPFGSFTPATQASGDKLQARSLTGRPILVQVTGFDPAKEVTDQNTKAKVIKPAVFVDVWDFLGGPAVPQLNIPAQPPNTVYVGAMWMSGNLVDTLKTSLGGPPMPARIVTRQAKNAYLAIVPLGNPEFDQDPQGPAQLQAVTQAFMADPQRFERERAARLAAAAQQQPAQQAGSFAPSAVQPTQQGGMAGWNGQQTMHPAAAQGQFPGQPQQQMPTGFPGAPAAAQQMPQGAPNGMTPGQQVNAGMMSPAQAVQAYTAPQGQFPGQPPAAPQFQPPAAPGGYMPPMGTQPADAIPVHHPAPQYQMPMAPDPAGAQAAQTMQGWQQAGFPGMPQGAPQQAPGQPGLAVNNGDVAAILAGLQAGAPQQ